MGIEVQSKIFMYKRKQQKCMSSACLATQCFAWDANAVSFNPIDLTYSIKVVLKSMPYWDRRVPV